MKLPEHGIVAVVDPVCSWCWGFTGILDRLRDGFEGRAPFHVILGGLRPGPSAERLGQIRSFLRQHWHAVKDRSGQPVNFDFLNREDDLLLDTELPCRAVTVARGLAAEKAFPVYHAVQRGLFVENRNIFDAAVLADIAGECGLDQERFAATFSSPRGRAGTHEDFGVAREMGVHGFPTLLAVDGDQIGLLTYGYTSYERLAPILETWMAGRLGAFTGSSEHT